MNEQVTGSDEYSILLTKVGYFDLDDALDFITIVSGRDLGDDSDYRDGLMTAVNETLGFRLDTTTYKKVPESDKLVMQKEPGLSLVSKRDLVFWIATHSEIVDSITPVTKNNRIPDNWATHSVETSTYLTQQDIEKLARKPTLYLEEVVQLLHFDRLPKDKMYPDMLDTYDTLEREILSNSEERVSSDSLYPSEEILTAAARLGYDIPEGLMHLVQTPIEGLGWSEKKQVIEADSQNHSESQVPFSAPATKIERRVKEIEKLANTMFPDPLNIAGGGKTKLGNSLCESMPSLFTEATFNKAWQQAKREKLIEVEDVDQYKKGK